MTKNTLRRTSSPVVMTQFRCAGLSVFLLGNRGWRLFAGTGFMRLESSQTLDNKSQSGLSQKGIRTDWSQNDVSLNHNPRSVPTLTTGSREMHTNRVIPGAIVVLPEH